MTPEEKADKEFEVIAWMNKKGYDRRASKEVAPIIVNYLQDVVNKNFIKPDVIKSLPLDFVKWYSGMEEAKILKAVERWKRESGNVL
jgi:hypothetical protein